MVKAQPIAEPDRENYAVLRKGQCRFESMVAGRLAKTLGNKIKLQIA